MERIGYKILDYSDLIEPSRLKQEILYFDKFFISTDDFKIHKRLAESWVKFQGTKGKGADNLKAVLYEIEYLEKNGLLELKDIYKDIKATSSRSTTETYLKLKDFQLEEVLRFERDLEMNCDFETFGFSMDLIRAANKISEVSVVNAGYFCSIVKDDHSTTVPIISDLHSFDFLSGFGSSRKTDILHLIIEKFPIPCNSTTWRKVLEFKQDADTSRKYTALTDWINEMANTNLGKREIMEKLDYLLSEYVYHMKIHKMKFEESNFELFLTTTLEVLENLLTLKFSTAIKALFDLKKRELDLLLSESVAPGREVAFLSKVMSTFSE